MNFKMLGTKEQFLKKAGEENGCCVSVGGLRGAVQQGECTATPILVSAFARFLELSRRQRKLTMEQFALQADIDTAELVELVSGQRACPELRTVYKLSQLLSLPSQSLMELSGLAKPKSSELTQAAVRFAARAESKQALSTEEERALEEFVQVITAVEGH